MASLLARAIDIADSLSPGRGRVNYRSLAHARRLSHDLAKDITRDPGRLSAHALALAHAPNRDRELASALDRDLARARDLARDLERDLALGRDRVLLRTLGLDSDLDLHLLGARHGDLVLALVLNRIVNRALNRAPVLALGADRADDMARGRALTRALTRSLRSALGVYHDLTRGLAPGRARDLAQFRDRALPLPDLPLILDLARQLGSVLAGALSDSLGIEHLDGLADALLDGALDDFSHADLSGRADLAHVPLTGVCWSVPGTHWPPGLCAEAIMQCSQETGPGSGLYVITTWETEKSPARGTESEEQAEA